MNLSAMDFLASVGGYAQAQRTSAADRSPKLATIDPAHDFDVGLNPRVTFDGESTMTTRRYPYMSGYVPLAGDRVAMLPVGTTYLILGSVSNYGDMGFGQSPADGYGTLNLGPTSYFTTDGAVTTAVLNGNSIHPNVATVSGLAFNSPTTQSVTSATYVDFTGTDASFSFTKREDGTRLWIAMSVGFYVTVADTGPQIGVRINGVDYGVGRHPGAMSVNSHEVASGTAMTPGGILAGTYTVTGRIYRVSGTGNVVRDWNDWHSITVMEVDG